MITKLSIIIPVFNEEKHIGEVLQNIISLQLAHNIAKQIIVVDDFSGDQSVKQIEETLRNDSSEIRFIKQQVNGGKGSAIRRAIEDVTGDYLIIQDADLELNPKDINLLINEVVLHQADIVYGSRFLKKQPYPIPFKTRLANRFLSLITSLLTRKKITDMETCYKLFKLQLLDDIRLFENRFGFEPEITMKLLKKKNIIYREVPITYKARSQKDGKKIGFNDGLRALYCLVKYYFND